MISSLDLITFHCISRIYFIRNLIFLKILVLRQLCGWITWRFCIYIFFLKLWLNVSIIATGNTSVSVPNTIGRYLTLCLRVSEVLYTTVLMLHICVLMQYVHSCPLSVLKTCTDSTNIKSGLLCKMLQTVHTNRRILMRHGVIWFLIHVVVQVCWNRDFEEIWVTCLGLCYS